MSDSQLAVILSPRCVVTSFPNFTFTFGRKRNISSCNFELWSILDHRTWPRSSYYEPACQISTSKVSSFKNICLIV